MIETLLADGLVSGPANKIATFAIKSLAVAGGGLIGYCLGWIVATLIDRWLFAKKSPPQLKKAVCIVSGVAVAVLLAIILFGGGGDGLFGGGGSGNNDGKGTNTPEDKGKQPPEVKPKDDTKKPPEKIEPKPPEPKATPGDVRIAILGGADVRDGKFYLVNEDPTPKTFDELKATLEALRAKSKEEVTLVFRFTKEQLGDNHPEMKKLTAWVKQTKLLNRFE